MFARELQFPTAIASPDDAGIQAAIEWSLGAAEEGDLIWVWTPLVRQLSSCPPLATLVSRHSDVHHIAGRGGGSPARTGPVLMAWPTIGEIGGMVRYEHRIRALAVISWDEELRSWVQEARPTVLGDGSPWESSPSPLDPVLVEALEGLTLTINHNNTITAGFEKDRVVSVLLALKDAGIAMDAEAVKGWALAHGWVGKNPQRLGDYVRDINQGKRPRSRTVLRADYIEVLRERLREK